MGKKGEGKGKTGKGTKGGKGCATKGGAVGSRRRSPRRTKNNQVGRSKRSGPSDESEEEADLDLDDEGNTMPEKKRQRFTNRTKSEAGKDGMNDEGRLFYKRLLAAFQAIDDSIFDETWKEYWMGHEDNMSGRKLDMNSVLGCDDEAEEEEEEEAPFIFETDVGARGGV